MKPYICDLSRGLWLVLTSVCDDLSAWLLMTFPKFTGFSESLSHSVDSYNACCMLSVSFSAGNGLSLCFQEEVK